MEDEKGVQLYELAYILEPGVPEDKLPEYAGKITGLIEKHGGSIVLADNPKIRTLAYTIERATGGKRQKFNQGYFGWLKFNNTPDKIEQLENDVKGWSEVIRHMIIHTVKSVSTFVPRRRPDTPRGTEGETSMPKPTEAELEKEVEQLIASV